jgi:CheY-like chemotaxis protein
MFDLVVTDYNMPGASGLDVVREAATLAPGLPVILACGFITDELSAKAAEAGVRHWFRKPNSIQVLCATIGSLLEAKSAP